MPYSSPDLAHAFNLGCDARLAGLPLTANDYSSSQQDAYQSWERGWRDVDQYWGKWTRGAAVPLPKVVEEEMA